MKIVGVEGLSPQQIDAEIRNGAKFVMYEYCISLLYITMKRPTSIYFVRAGESAITRGLPWTALSLVMGWWGIPFGPIYTIGALINNCKGGKDLTAEVNAALQPRDPQSAQTQSAQTQSAPGAFSNPAAPPIPAPPLPPKNRSSKNPPNSPWSN